jgi:hypothetical protein
MDFLQPKVVLKRSLYYAFVAYDTYIFLTRVKLQVESGLVGSGLVGSGQMGGNRLTSVIFGVFKNVKEFFLDFFKISWLWFYWAVTLGAAYASLQGAAARPFLCLPLLMMIKVIGYVTY